MEDRFGYLWQGLDQERAQPQIVLGQGLGGVGVGVCGVGGSVSAARSRIRERFRLIRLWSPTSAPPICSGSAEVIITFNSHFTSHTLQSFQAPGISYPISPCPSRLWAAERRLGGSLRGARNPSSAGAQSLAFLFICVPLGARWLHSGPAVLQRGMFFCKCAFRIGDNSMAAAAKRTHCWLICIKIHENKQLWCGELESSYWQTE